MVGIPRTKACQNCKRRRVKCDENWPTCSQCRRSKTPCPGPTTTSIRFVSHNGPESAKQIGTSEQEPSSTAAKPEQAVRKSVIKRFVMVNPSPRTPPVAPVDHLSSCLATLLEYGPEGCTFLQKSPIRYIPRRLSQSSPVVVDMISLFCSVWTDHCHQQPPSQVTSRRYDIALRGLQNALQKLPKGRVDRAQMIDTLTAITLLQKTQPLLSREADPSWGVHAVAIKHMMIEMGPPEKDDSFEAALVKENRSLLIRNRLAGGPEVDFLNESPWKEAMVRLGTEDWLVDELEPFGSEDCFKLELRTPRMQDWADFIVRIRTEGPYTEEMKGLSAIVINEMLEHAELLRRTIGVTTKALLARGTMVVKTDPSELVAFMRKSYSFTHASAAAMFCTLVSVQVIVLRSLYEFSVMYDGVPDEALYTEYRDVCGQIWMVIPYIHTLKPVTGLAMLGTISVTFEAAVGEEREKVIDVVNHLDSYLLRFNKDRAMIADFLLHVCKAVTGRVPVHGHLSWITT
ncbi:unnamed protein product [Clonostachys rosea f. rosea IK726]|uniref:Zn(2)-C6 fungal-type domain-containing protein n=2 Tax=Bionectria ochroleuca TaxID=29856 RepID=A0A8H7KAD0_BIOOC|nr:unnamed protein product [Clonostachys rosea f. rosea IK726]